ncbi:MAG: hypothetical protein KF871_17015 [Hydrogenophaga sp.]|uniref:hypothetical protein n=1 Tax=Hydrogenophaga sp. TaxID=1904254 RepID=UPI001DDB3178|nr:hypothetical protein [Hydrogenophaga sp.]MBX3611598.1 hypothetical protein [Hydrogenophaga sp.]
MSTSRLIQFVALCLLVLFFLPYVIKLQQVDLIIVLLAGIAMPVYDFIRNKDN